MEVNKVQIAGMILEVCSNTEDRKHIPNTL